MSLRRIIFVLIALVASGSTIVIGRMWLEAQRAQQVVEKPAEQPTGPSVLVAKGNLPAGTFIRPESLRWQMWPEANVAASYVVQSKHRLEDYVGAVVRSGISDGEPLTDTRVVRPGDRGFLSAVLTPGYRAVTVNVSPSAGLAGLVFPGDKVDLIGAFHVEFEAAKDGTAHPAHYASETVLTDVRILAVDQRVDDQNKEVVVAKTATLEVTPKQAEIISVVSESGKFSLSLRSLAPGDGATEVASDAHTYTWDSDAISMLSPPGGNGATKKVSVIHGDKAESFEFPRSTR
jgi:pilus assembly protein CpaB